MSILAGCAVTTPPYPSVDNYSVAEAPSPSGSVAYRGYLVAGKLVKINDPELPGDVQMIVGQSYQSALGSQCYRVRRAESDAVRDPVALCNREDDTWFVAPRIWSRQSSNVNQ